MRKIPQKRRSTEDVTAKLLPTDAEHSTSQPVRI
jgi:hypothetical protein